MGKLTLEEQITVLQNIDCDYLYRKRIGLCHDVWSNLDTYHLRHKQPEGSFLSDYIPLFTRDNAVKYFNADRLTYWWMRDENGYMQRKLFLEWIINKLKDQLEIENNRKKK